MTISLEEFEQVVQRSFRLQQEIDEIKSQQVKPLEQELAEIERVILDNLEKLDTKTYKSKLGSVTRTTRTSVVTPKTPEDKEKLFGWLKEQGEDWFYAYTSVNSQSLNALYKQELEKAKEAGDFDFSIPGVGEPTFSYGLTRRKA